MKKKLHFFFLCRRPSTIEKRVNGVFQQVVRARTRNNNNNSNYNYRRKRLFLSNGSVKKLNRDNSRGPQTARNRHIFIPIVIIGGRLQYR